MTSRNIRTILLMTSCLMLSAPTTVLSEQNQPGSLVSLPMYELSDSLKKADDIFWNRLATKLRSRGIDAPEALERNTGPLVKHWLDERLLLSQACGYPYVASLMGHGVKIVATPVYATNDDLPPGDYRSVLIVREGTSYKSLADLKGKKAGINEANSNSGMNVFRAAVAAAFAPDVLEAGVFEKVVETGGHLISVRKVAEGEIDVAAIDSVTYDLIQRNHPQLAAQTRILANSEPSPGLPLVTGPGTSDEDVGKMREALKETVSNTNDPELMWALKEMRLKDFVVIDQETYRERIGKLQVAAKEKGYPVLK